VAELSEDYIARMEDVLEVYERPPDSKQPVVCLDEKPVTLHTDVRPASPAVPGREARRDNEYERRGTANVFCAVEPKAGRHFTFATPNRSAFQFAQVAFQLTLRYPDAETIHLVINNLNIHCRKSLTDRYGKELGAEIWDRFTVHCTPTHGSWLNQAEIEIGIFSRHCLGFRRIPDLKDPAPGSSGLESPNEPRPDKDQLAVHPQSRPSEVRLPKETLQAVTDLAFRLKQSVVAMGDQAVELGSRSELLNWAEASARF
jgi:hypothetical protein